MELYRTATPPEMTEDDRKTAELAKAVAGSMFMGKTREGSRNGYTPRPSRDDEAYRADRDDSRLRDHQRQWDAAEAWAKHNDDLGERRRKEREDAKDAERQRIQAADDERTQAARASLEERLRYQFLSTPGTTEVDWQRNKEAILDEHFRAGIHATERAARRAQASIYGDF